MAILAKNHSGAWEITERWDIDDVYETCPWLTPDQALEVMIKVVDGFDANYGICYDTFSDTATSLGFDEPEENDSDL